MKTKVIVGIIVLCTLVCSNFGVYANPILNKSTPSYKSLNAGGSGYEILLNESFSAGIMPPTDWKLTQTNPSETWYVDPTLPFSPPYCVTVHRGNNLSLQNEWLITPPLDFTNYHKDVFLSFRWYTSCYVAHWKDYIDLNIQISPDNGSTWYKVWSDDNMTSNYSSWSWIDTENGKAINISKYHSYPQVKIGFQYYSNVTDLAPYQELSIDDILVYAQAGPAFGCSAGGPYDWCWDNQHMYYPAGVRFNASLYNMTWWKCQWLWDFGDNSTSNLPFNPIHDYKDIGTYTVTLRVIENSTQRVAYDSKPVHIFLMPVPQMDIRMKQSLLGIQALIVNDGIYNATNINWTVKVRYGLMNVREIKAANGTLDKVGPKNISKAVKSGYFFGFGRIHIDISAIPENIPGVSKSFIAFKIGPFVINEHNTTIYRI
jgi:hypothetical protein